MGSRHDLGPVRFCGGGGGGGGGVSVVARVKGKSDGSAVGAFARAVGVEHLDMSISSGHIARSVCQCFVGSSAVVVREVNLS